MTRQICLRIVSVALIVGAAVIVRLPVLKAGPHAGAQAQAATAAADAAKASPDLINALAKEIGGTPEQAAGAAGALFGIAKSRLKADEFSKIAAAVPGMDALLGAAPATGMMGAAGAAPAAFTKLGLSPDLVNKAVPALTSFVAKSGGADVGSLFASAFK